MPILSKVRQCGKMIVLIDNIIIILGFYIVFPLISIHFINSIGWTAVFVGFALGFRQLVQQGIGIVGGAIADYFGAKPMIVLGMLLRAFGFILMALAHQPWMLLLSCLFSALGGVLFDPPRAALAVKFTRPYERNRFFSIMMIQDHAGTVIGALLGSWLVQFNFQLVCWTGALVFILCAVFNIIFLPAYKTSLTRVPVLKSMKQVINDRRFTFYVLALTGYYILAVQVMLMLPLTVSIVSGDPSTVKWMYSIQAILSLTLLYPISAWSEKYFRLEQRLLFGLLLMTSGFILIAFTSSLFVLLIFIGIFYLGSIIAEPARETLSASLSDPHARGSYLGFSKLGLAFGGLIGYTGGGWLYDLAMSLDMPKLPWLFLGVIGIVTWISLYYLTKNISRSKHNRGLPRNS